MNDQIFISYRRDDALGSAGRLYDRLITHFEPEKIFMDVDTIEPGLDFVEVIQNAVSSCDVLLAIIGPRWSSVTDESGVRRLNKTDDFVRIEIAIALRRNIRVIPVLVQGADMPSESQLPEELKILSRRNAITISHERFNVDAERLIHVLDKALAKIEPNKVIRKGSENFKVSSGNKNKNASKKTRSQKYAFIYSWIAFLMIILGVVMLFVTLNSVSGSPVWVSAIMIIFGVVGMIYYWKKR
jgi:hypothetical protein